MKFSSPLKEAILISRYKRFLADVRLPDGSTMTLHCPNTGSMLHCAEPGSRVWYSHSSNAGRHYPCTWELVEVDHRFKVGINTGNANILVAETLKQRHIDILTDYTIVRREVTYGRENSRIDFLLEGSPQSHVPPCYLEVKSVTLGLENGIGAFPDALTLRGQKHLRELKEIRHRGARAVLFFCVQHEGIDRVRPADDIDPVYGRLLREAVEAGVEVMAMRARISLTEMSLSDPLPVLL